MSTAIGFRFLAGRYHATPWGTHVNEAAVEWPPSPWRVLRSLIAIWHRKVDPQEVSEEELARVIERLAQHVPRYRLPPAVHTHSRHYMPTRKGRRDKNTLVFDAFARIASDERLVMIWPDLDLEARDRENLTVLLHRLGYLGRAESWVEATLLEDDWTEGTDCSPLGSDGESPVESETVSLPAPVEPDAYRAWRKVEVEARGLDRSGLGVRDKRLLATLPPRLIDALRLDTGQIRAQGWSRHPGMRFIPYLRPSDALDARRTAKSARTTDRKLTTVRLILRGKPLIPRGTPLPRIEDAIKIGEVVRAAAMSRADRNDESNAPDGAVPPELSGHGMGEDNVHGHAFYLPEDADRDGHIDHVLVHAQAGLSREAVDALTDIDRIWLDEGLEWGVIFDAAGYTEESSDEPGASEALWGHPYLARSRTWVSVTPYLHPWYRKKTFGIQDQILRECRERELPEPALERIKTVRVRDRDRRPVHFHRFRTRGRRRASQPDTHGSFWRLTFPEAVSGPLALGFGCHFGLGIFSAV